MCIKKMREQVGISLIELIIFIAVVSAALGGVLLMFNKNSSNADPLVRKQALAVAQSMMEEVQLRYFRAASGVFAGPYTQANRPLFDDVFDYNGFATSGVLPADGTATPIPGLANYNVNVVVAGTALGAITATSAARITVTVSDPNGGSIVLDGFRTDY